MSIAAPDRQARASRLPRARRRAARARGRRLQARRWPRSTPSGITVGGRRQRDGRARARRAPSTTSRGVGSSARRSPSSRSCALARRDGDRADAARLLVSRAAHASDSGAATGSPPRRRWPSLRDRGGATHRSTKRCSSTAGRGVLAMDPVERLYRAVRPLRIYEGTTEIQKLIIAGGVLDRAAATPDRVHVEAPTPAIRHALPGVDPTAAEAARLRLFSPVRRPRAWSRADLGAGDGALARDRGRLRHAGRCSMVRRFAEARPGAMVVEATGIRDVPSGPLLRIGHDRFLPGLERAGGDRAPGERGPHPLFIQIIDFLRIRRRPEPRALLPGVPGDHRPPPAPRGCADAAGRRRRARGAAPRSAGARLARRARPAASWRASRYGDARAGHRHSSCRTSASCRAVLPGLFAAAAERAERAGFDGVELHYAHAYTMASFLSALNDRDRRLRRARGSTACGSRSRSIAAVRDARRPGLRGRLPLPRRRVHRGRQQRRRRRLVRRRAGARRHGLPLALARRQVRGRQAAQGGLGRAIPTPARAATNACRRCVSDARRPVRPQRASRRARSGRRCARAGLDHAGGRAGGIATFEQAEEHAAARARPTSSARRGRALADPDWFRKLAARPGRRGAALRVHQLLRGARPGAQAGDLPALGPS